MSQRNPEKVANALPWSERVNAISVNPYMATIADIARLAAELSEFQGKTCPDDCEHLKGNCCLLGANHCIRDADDYYKSKGGV